MRKKCKVSSYGFIWETNSLPKEFNKYYPLALIGIYQREKSEKHIGKLSLTIQSIFKNVQNMTSKWVNSNGLESIPNQGSTDRNKIVGPGPVRSEILISSNLLW